MIRISLDNQRYNTFVKVYDGDELITDRAYARQPGLKDTRWHMGLLTQMLEHLGLAYEVEETDWLAERLGRHGNDKG